MKAYIYEKDLAFLSEAVAIAALGLVDEEGRKIGLHLNFTTLNQRVSEALSAIASLDIGVLAGDGT